MEKSERRYEIDWLRIVLIASVFLFHIGMFFNPWHWHVKNSVQYPQLVELMGFLHCWRMPLLFFVSGAGTFLALGKRSIWEYVKERNKRLMLPFFFGLFTLVPIQVYLEKFTEYSSLWNFYMHVFDGVYPEGNMSWHHLWFILYLFFLSMVAIPIIKWLRSNRSQNFLSFINRIACKKGGMLLFVVPILISQLILRQFWPNSTHGFIDDWAYMFMYFFYFIYGYLFANSKEMTKSVISQRYLNVLVATSVYICYRVGGELIVDDTVYKYFHATMDIMLAWSTGITVLGFFCRYMRFNSPFRKFANEAIYPFYLLHQPIILLFGFYIKDIEMNIVVKALYLTVSSFAASVGIYLLLIRPFNFMRVVFGLKARKKEQLQLEAVKTK
ncbi:acyltransferase [Marinifilum sp. D714]|uniref:acyltransferase family protein n=1 Tax=Marinifilum sp. D714 TaxID=2937523 RepID=UPI0027C00578|nr:acyltransferase [Marinifilum sp. D714]MDQ2179950.1 acyltransferase [Marinifilum sp. D714]